MFLAQYRSLVASVLLAHANTAPDKHPNELCGPSANNILPVISHGPLEAAGRLSHRPSTHRSIISEEHGSGNNKDNELDEAGDEGAVGREDTRPPSPSSNEHAKEVEEDEAKGKLVDSGDDTQTTAKFLTVDIAVVDNSKIGFQRVKEDSLVGIAH